MKKENTNCQSCGMPLKKDKNKGGTNADGTKSMLYCSLCFREGKFINSEMTVDQMQSLVKGKLKEFGFPGFLASLFTKRIPKLERWKSK